MQLTALWNYNQRLKNSAQTAVHSIQKQDNSLLNQYKTTNGYNQITKNLPVNQFSTKYLPNGEPSFLSKSQNKYLPSKSQGVVNPSGGHNTSHKHQSSLRKTKNPQIGNRSRFQKDQPDIGDQPDNRDQLYSRDEPDNRDQLYSRDQPDNRDQLFSRDQPDNRDQLYTRDQPDNRDQLYSRDTTSYQSKNRVLTTKSKIFKGER